MAVDNGMTPRERLLLIQVMEECAEVTQRVSKALRFGMDEVQPGQELPNRERLRREIADLLAVIDMYDPILASFTFKELDDKKAKVEEHLRYSATKSLST